MAPQPGFLSRATTGGAPQRTPIAETPADLRNVAADRLAAHQARSRYFPVRRPVERPAATTDNSQAFGPKVAKHYAADYQVNAISGRGIVRNFNGSPAILCRSPIHLNCSNTPRVTLARQEPQTNYRISLARHLHRANRARRSRAGCRAPPSHNPRAQGSPSTQPRRRTRRSRTTAWVSPRRTTR
jgi:hypothetical protein